MMRAFRRHRRSLTLDRWARKVGDGEIDPKDAQALALGNADKPDALYIPVPKAANTSIRTALLPCYGLQKEDVRRVHRDTRLDVRGLNAALSDAVENAYVFTVVRHPATRILSAYSNKIGRFKPRFGHAARLGIAKSSSFDEFLEILSTASPWAIDGHFKPQATWLHYGLRDPRLQIYKMETLQDDWPQIHKALLRKLPVGPEAKLDMLNSTKAPKDNFTTRQKRLIDGIFGEDFDRFGYSWGDLAPRT